MENEGEPDVVAINSASVRKPGGGFLGEAKGQEEDLAGGSALYDYDCLLIQPRYYEITRGFNSALYTDHLIYSPKVSFLGDARLNLLEQPFYPSIITSPKNSVTIQTGCKGYTLARVPVGIPPPLLVLFVASLRLVE